MARKIALLVERDRDARHRKPGSARRVVVAAAAARRPSATSASSCRSRCSASIVTWPMRSRLWVLYAMTLAYAASVVMFYVFARYRYPLVPVADAVRGGRAWRRCRGAGSRLAPRSIAAQAGGHWTLAAVAVAAVFANWPMLSTDADAGRHRNQPRRRAAGAKAGSTKRPRITSARSRCARTTRRPTTTSATALRAQGPARRSGRDLRARLALQPDYPDAHYNLANALLDQGKAARRRSNISSVALRVDPRFGRRAQQPRHRARGEGKADEAMAEFRAALQPIRLRQGAPQPWRPAGRHRGAAPTRSIIFDAPPSSRPADAATHYDFGSVLLEAGRLDEAINEFRAALAIDAGIGRGPNNLGIALGSQGKLDEAIAEFQPALKLQPGFRRRAEEPGDGAEAEKR